MKGKSIERGGETEREKCLTGFTSPMAVAARAWPEWSQEPGALSRSCRGANTWAISYCCLSTFVDLGFVCLCFWWIFYEIFTNNYVLSRYQFFLYYFMVSWCWFKSFIISLLVLYLINESNTYLKMYVSININLNIYTHM